MLKTSKSRRPSQKVTWIACIIASTCLSPIRSAKHYQTMIRLQLFTTVRTVWWLLREITTSVATACFLALNRIGSDLSSLDISIVVSSSFCLKSLLSVIWLTQREPWRVQNLTQSKNSRQKTLGDSTNVSKSLRLNIRTSKTRWRQCKRWYTRDCLVLKDASLRYKTYWKRFWLRELPSLARLTVALPWLCHRSASRGCNRRLASG